MANFVAIAALLIVLGVAVAYIVREKKKGHKCVGCPYAAECAKAKNGGCAQ
ncbi:MAG: FeoB-associated Cys-rich membrane protein [Clostridia bacterium]|nr:FeoB-associated Cys-rich membrane protein [Clostridia bacterium]